MRGRNDSVVCINGFIKDGLRHGDDRNVTEKRRKRLIKESIVCLGMECKYDPWRLDIFTSVKRPNTAKQTYKSEGVQCSRR
jgi:hypothetical protein